MALRAGVLVDGPLAGSRVYVHLFALGYPMRHILVFERPPSTIREWVDWKLWSKPPEAASHRYLLHLDDETRQGRYELREVRYVFDPEHVHRDETVEPVVPTRDARTPRRLPTEVVFVPRRWRGAGI
jgi:hypothetical protein